jgi:anti-anti-sigma regulatory factor
VSTVLDFSLHEQGELLVLAFGGRLEADSADALRAQLSGMGDRGRHLVIDLSRAQTVSREVVLALLEFLSLLQGRGGTMSLVCNDADALDHLRPYRNLFNVHPTLPSLLQTGLAGGYRNKGFRWSRRTGVRLSTPLATFLGLLLSGWVVTLMVLVLWQYRLMDQERAGLMRLQNERDLALQQAHELETRVKPLADLGLLEMPGKGKQSRPKPRPKPEPESEESPAAPAPNPPVPAADGRP